MPNTLFASNNPKHWGATIGSGNTNFDATRVPYSIAINQSAKSPKFKESTTNDTWLHFRLKGAGIGGFSNGNIADAIYVKDHLNRTLMRMIRQWDANFDVTVYDTNGGSNALSGNAGNLNLDQFWDIHVHHTAFVLELTLYINSVQKVTHTYGTNPGSVTGIGYLEFASGLYSGTGDAQLSEVIVSDSSTLGARLNMITPALVGHYSDWDGDVTTLVDQLLTTGLTTPTANMRSSLILNDYTKNEIISNLVLSSQNSKGINAPSKIRHFLRRATVDYDAAIAHDVLPSVTAHQTDYPSNPATSLPWAMADLAATEFGFKSEV